MSLQILITGGAGFVGSQLARMYREKYPTARIVAFDNLRRRGSELNLGAFKRAEIEFVHGDIRSPTDLASITGNFDLFIEASAEPSVLTGMQGDSPTYAIETNLVGTAHCLELARRKAGFLSFLSTSRVYSIPALSEIPLRTGPTRFEIDTSERVLPGLSEKGVAEEFPIDRFRSIYGTTKLASEYLVQEYCHAYGLKAVVNRCGVLAGPGQFGKVDQGVFTLWVAHHQFGKSLRYTGFGGKGLQVRDILHPRDLFELLEKQFALANSRAFQGEPYNIGGGKRVSTSLKEWTDACVKATGRKVDIVSQPESSSVDIPLYLTDYSKAEAAFDWTPKIDVDSIAKEIQSWLSSPENEEQMRLLFG